MTYFATAALPTTTSLALIPLRPTGDHGLEAWLATQDAPTRAWVATQRFTAEAGTQLLLPSAQGTLRAVLVGYEKPPYIWSVAHLPATLPAGDYHIDAPHWSAEELTQAALGFALAQYQFTRYRTATTKPLTLHLPASVDHTAITRMVDAITLTRDLINTPANDCTPATLAVTAEQLAEAHGATCRVITGETLLAENYPAIYAVGKASATPPCFITLEWGNPADPLVVLVGKGVTFDTGGLDLKPYNSMKLMKKDMGGAATMLGLTQWIMQTGLKLRLKLLIPAVENAVAGNAFRPQDILQTRKGLTMEIGSTDAEGRVILADALTNGDADAPVLMIDIATLTGAARTALGTELPALFSNRDEIARNLMAQGFACHDPLWQLPLWDGYRKYVNGTIADVTNSPNYGFAGSITAALFLERFVSPTTPWVHLDSYAWNAEAQPGRPAGGEALGLRTIAGYLQERFGKV